MAVGGDWEDETSLQGDSIDSDVFDSMLIACPLFFAYYSNVEFLSFCYVGVHWYLLNPFAMSCMTSHVAASSGLQ